MTLRDELRAFLDGYAQPRAADSEHISIFSEIANNAEVSDAKSWQRALDEAGLGAITWPVEHGGRAGGLVEALVFAEEIARFETPLAVLQIGLSMVGPTIIAHGDEVQQARYLPPMRRGDEVWCQLWSEPGAGSDLASVASRATLDDERGRSSSTVRRCGPAARTTPTSGWGCSGRTPRR